MTGANYTGGKRNVARTRFRDSTRRIQKGHFGRRRLGILSRGLVNGVHSRAEVPTCGMSGIQLEHAQKDISRPPHLSPAREMGTVGAFASGGSSASSSSIGSNFMPSNSRIAHILDNGSYASFRTEVDRILEFSRTVGLCNYATSSMQGAPEALTSRLDSGSERPSPHQQRHEDLPMSESSGGQGTNACIDHATQAPKPLRTRTQLHSPRETVSFTSNCEFLEYYVSHSPAKSRSTAEPQLCQETGSPGLLEGDPCPTDPLPPSFDALEFSTSPLPPSSPLHSSTTYGSLLSLCQLPHEAEATILDPDRIPLPSMLSGSYDVDSSFRYGHSRHITSDLASTSSSRHLPGSGLVQNKVPTLLPSSSKADRIHELLTCNNPWNAIGDVLNLPPIPSADAAYLSNIRSLNTLRVSSRASSSSGQADIRELLSPARAEGTRSRAVHSDGDLLIRPDPSQLRFSREAIRRVSLPLVSQDSSTKRVFSPIRSFRSTREARLLSHAEPLLFSPSESVPSEAPQPVLMPRALDGNTRLASESSSTPVKALSPSPRISTPQKSTSPSPKNLNLLDISISQSPRVVSTQWDAMVGLDLAALIPKVPTTQATPPKGQRPKLECPDLFQDEDSLTGIF